MQINITSKQLDMTPTIKEYARGKSEKLTRFYDRIEQIDMKIEKTTHGFIVELISDVAMSEGLRFAIREGGRTVGAGQITKLL